MFIKNILPLLVLLLAGISGYIYVYPKYTDISALKGQEAKYDSALDTANQVASLSTQLSQTIESISPEDQALLDTLLPNEVNRLKLGNDIVEIAKFHNITLTELSFGDKTQGDTGEQRSGQLNPTTITLGFTASYKVFKDFMVDLEKSLQILDIVEFSVNPQDREPYEYNITLNTYSLSSDI